VALVEKSLKGEAHTDDKDELDVREGLNLGGDVVDVALVEGSTAIGDGEFTIGSQSSAVTVGEIVNNERKDVVAARSVLSLDIFGKGGDGWHLGPNITVNKVS